MENLYPDIIDEIIETNIAETIDVCACTLKDLFSFDSQYVIRIPDYQRPYEWKEQQLQVLLRDFKEYFSGVDFSGHLQENYFMGSVLLHEKNNNTFEIIDGQQRITSLLILDFVLNKNNSAICLHKNNLQLLYNSRDSRNNIIDAKKYFEEFASGYLIEDWYEKLLSSIEFTLIITRSQDDAFTFFDTQNNRGVTLSAVDFLKSYHLRELKGAVDKQTVFAKKWDYDNANQFLMLLFETYLWRGRRWKGTVFDYENRDQILLEFQEKTLSKSSDGRMPLFPNRKNRLSATLEFIPDKGICIDPVPIFLRTTAIEYPFSIRQPIEKGTGFFLYSEKYAALYNFIFNKSHAEGTPLWFLNNFKYVVYEKSGFSDYLLDLFDLCILMYFDKFEEEKLSEFTLWLDHFIGSFRINLGCIFDRSPIKILRERPINLLDVIDLAYLPGEIFEFLKNNTNEDFYRNEEIGEGNGVRERYKLQLHLFFGRQYEKKLEKKLNWVIDYVNSNLK